MQNIKQSLIEEINKRVQDKILEPTNAELLIKLINNAESSDEAINIAALGTTYKRTGLHFDKRLEKMTDSIKYFKKNEKLSFRTDDSKPVNKLIIGDNYQALQNLLIQYKGQIDVIYIDPPYGKDSMGEFAKTNYTNAITRDNLLSMLYPRLILAKQLLSDEGVIFCSIDDKNQAYVKCLFDEVFGEENFIANFIIKSNPRGSMSAEEIANLHEYLLCYTTNRIESNFVGLDLSDEMIGEYKLEDNKGKYRLLGLRMRGGFWRRSERPNLFFPIYVNPKTNEISLEKTTEFTKEVLPVQPSTNEEGTWRWSKEKIQTNNEMLIGKEVKRNDTTIWDIFQKDYLERENGRKTKAKSIWDENEENNQNGTVEVKNILGSTALFAFPKPKFLIQKCIQLVTSNSKPITILDFFAGSGTTGHAVLDLNKSDGGNRTFILCQINEKTEENPNGIAYDVTSKRLKRIMTGECYDGTKDFPWLKDNEPYGGNLDVYEIESVANFENSPGKSPFDVIDETLYGKEKFTTVKEKIDWVCSNFEKTQKELGE